MKDFITLVPRLCDGFVQPVEDLSFLDNFHMRNKDAEEALSATGMKSPLQALRQSILHSTYSWTISVNGKVLGVFGIAETDYENYGCPWLLGSPDLDKWNSIRFIRYSKLVIESFHILYPSLLNFVIHDYYSTLKWLKFLGFEISDEPYILTNKPFYMFWKHKEVRE